MNQQTVFMQIDSQRHKQGFLSITELLDAYQTSTVLDPFSTLISDGVVMGANNVLYPNVIIEARNGGTIHIGGDNIFYPGTLLFADGGKIEIGNNNIFGDGGVRIKANRPDAHIVFGDLGRYMNNPEMMGQCRFGNGTQILGAITVQNCVLGAGESYTHTDPDARGGLLKGYGLARNLTVEQGAVINGRGDFQQSQIERQASYHPKPK